MLYDVYSRMIQEKTSAIIRKIPGIVIVCYFVIALVPLSTGHTRFELRKKILSQYNKTVSPGFETTPSDVGIVISRPRIAQLDELASVMSVEANLLVNWYDVRLKWDDDPTYNNITWLSVNIDAIWKPKMNIFSSGRAQIYKNTGMPLFIRRNGLVFWPLMGDYNFVCVQEDLRWYPLDSHTCKLSVGSLYPQEVFSRFIIYWNYTTHGVNRRHPLIANPHWDQLSLEHSDGVTSATAEMVYPTDDFIFKVRRQGWPLLATFLPLMIGFMFLSWMSYALPPRGDMLSKRLTVSTTSLFLSSVFLLVLIKTVPGVGSRPPVIVIAYASIVFLEFFTCLHNLVMVNNFPRLSAHLGTLKKLPKQVQYVLGLNDKSVGGKGLLVNEEISQEVGLEQFPIEPGPEESSILVGSVYDRVHVSLQATIVILVVAVLCLE